MAAYSKDERAMNGFSLLCSTEHDRLSWPENEGDIETVFFCEFILFTSLLFVVVFTYIMIGYGGHVINNGGGGIIVLHILYGTSHFTSCDALL